MVGDNQTAEIPEGSLVAWEDPFGSDCREWTLSYFQYGDNWSDSRKLMPIGYVHLASYDTGVLITRHANKTHTANMFVMREGPRKYHSAWESAPVVVHTHPSIVPRIADVLIHAGVPGCTSRGAAREIAREGVLFVQWTLANEWTELTDTDRDIRTKEFLVRKGRSKDYGTIFHVKVK